MAASRGTKPKSRATAAVAVEREQPPAALEQLDEAELGLLVLASLARDPEGVSVHAERQAIARRLVERGLASVSKARRGERLRVEPSLAMHLLELAEARGALASVDLGARELVYWSIDSVPVELRLAILRDDAAGLHQTLARSHRRGEELGRWVMQAIGRAPRVAWIERIRDDGVRAAYLRVLLRSLAAELEPLPQAILTLAQRENDKPLRLELGRVLILRGEFDRALGLDRLPKWGPEALELLAAFWSGDFAGAVAIGERTLVARKHKPLPELEGICQLVATIVEAAGRPLLLESIHRQLGSGWSRAVELDDLTLVYRRLLGETVTARPRAKDPAARSSFTCGFVALLHDAWLSPAEFSARGEDVVKPRRHARALAQDWQARAEAGGYRPVAVELAAIVAALGGEPATRLAGAFRPLARWESALANLEALVAQRELSEADREASAVVWEVVAFGPSVVITPRVRKGSRAKKGQVVALARLHAGDHGDLLDESDRRVLACASATPFDRRPSYLPETAILALIGHPRVIDGEGRPLAVERGRATIRTSAREGMIEVKLEPAELARFPLVVDAKQPGRLVVYERERGLEPLAIMLAERSGLVVPDQARERLAGLLHRVSHHAAVELTGELSMHARDVVADPRPLLQLGWANAALTVQARVAPLGLAGPIVLPGVGAAQLVAQVRVGDASELQRTTRDLAAERAAFQALLDACPTLASYQESDQQWQVDTLHGALEVVLELEALGQQVELAWRAGQKLDPPKPAEAGLLRLAVTKGGAWFDVDVTLALDEQRVLGYRELLRGRVGPRFVALPRGEFLVLSDRLRAQLAQLESLGSAHEGALRVSAAALPALDELASDTVDPRFDAGTRARLEQLKKIATMVPKLPRNFGATLRDYQREGFTWLARLAEAGLGGCLADDMGLGKTVQALALLAQRARKGPALVVCPTSVVNNWIAEAARFTTSLRFASLVRPDEREALLASLGPRSVVVCSYALLASEIERLAGLQFATVVFDEAHALKNSHTQRSTAARRLSAEVRIALTGTPLENHLGELWSLFDAILPGMLGGEAEFERRFVAVKDEGERRERRAQLRALLRPFVLRRLKSQVLDELPARTEITLEVEPYPEQRAYYEAMRRTALERTARLNPKTSRLHILSEITRLRQAAVDPRLVDPEVGPAGAKLDVLLARLTELREEGHRALVFTQFLGAFRAVGERLAAAGIEHFELDGSTPASERARRIEAFQAGEGDVFLLSLRAGGVGVNLTGADYVFHLDPWWNPAVEDQASDRAHRIGQTRPVTIYRLITAGTIEPKILALHGSKRELAEDMLAGLERGEVLDVAQLVDLMAG